MGHVLHLPTDTALDPSVFKKGLCSTFFFSVLCSLNVRKHGADIFMVMVFLDVLVFLSN
jgi:hypothetical protein